jgi:hypothetical protein
MIAKHSGIRHDCHALGTRTRLESLVAYPLASTNPRAWVSRLACLHLTRVSWKVKLKIIIVVVIVGGDVIVILIIFMIINIIHILNNNNNNNNRFEKKITIEEKP